MQLDKKTLDRLLDLSDGQLRVLLKRLLAEYGVDPAAVPLEQMDIGKLRDFRVSGINHDNLAAAFFGCGQRLPPSKRARPDVGGKDHKRFSFYIRHGSLRRTSPREDFSLHTSRPTSDRGLSTEVN